MVKILKNFLALMLGLGVSLLILEIFLRIYNPIPNRIKGGKIVLPVNQKLTIKNNTNPKLDAVITHTKNSLGFRGEEMPADFEKSLSIIVVGGSTAEEYYLSDEKTWPYLLAQNLKANLPNIWINNAGLDGHSTFGHQILLDDYLADLQPKYIIYLIGINDVERGDLNSGFDNKLLKNSYASWKDYAAKKSELANLLINFVRAYNAKKKGLSDHSFRFENVSQLMTDEDSARRQLAAQTQYLSVFKARVEKLVSSTLASGITPILVTQPILWGEGVDATTGLDLANAKVLENRNGKLFWQILELYNDQTRAVAAEGGVKLVDLAKLMPKNSLYYYDGIHYTNEGAAKIAEILSADLTSFLKEKINP